MIDKLTKNLKTIEDYKQFTTAQHKTITELSKKIQMLEMETEHLKTMLKDSTPVIEQQGETLLMSGTESDDEIIAKIQLAKLKKISFDRELTLEETRRTEIFSKILATKEQPVKDDSVDLGKLPLSDVIKMVDYVPPTG